MTIDVSARRTQRRLALLSAAAAVIAAALLAVQPLVALIAALAAPLILSALRQQGGLTAICWLADGRWQLLHGGRRIDATLRRESRAGNRWVWLRWDTADRGPGRIRSLLLTHEDIPAAELRRLIVRLRLDAFAGPEYPADLRWPVSGRQQRVPEIPGA